MAIELPWPLAVVCHDAGAANLVIAELKASAGTYLPVMQGPAAQLWKDAGFSATELLPLEQALPRAAAVLTGTGWASHLEHEARRLARAQGLYCVAAIDHWVNYAERFVRDEEVVLPDEIWVFDGDAYALARRLFPSTPIRQRPNLYLAAQLHAIEAAPGPEPGRLLCLMEPIRYSWPGLAQPGEFEALDFLVRHLDQLAPGLRLRLRPHPSDPAGKYDAWLAAHPGLDVALDDKRSLATAVAAAEWVAGCETAALAVALAAGRKAVSILPPASPRCRLPQAGLLHLREMPGVSWPVAAPD